MKPLISVIIPNYNHADFLKDRLDSVINQTYTNIEVIILDDASTDSSKVIIDQFKVNSKVRHIIYNETNSGRLFLQWQKGIELATGKYVWIAESDDDARTNFLELLIPVLENDDELMLMFSDSERDDFNWKKLHQEIRIQTQIFLGEDFVRQKMLTSPAIVNASAVLFRRNTVKEDIFHLNTNFKTAFDWLFWCTIALQGKVGFYPVKLNLFRKHLKNTSSITTKQGLFVIEGLQVISFLKIKHQINLNISQIKIWSSVWAQTTLLLNNKKNILFKGFKKAWAVSPQILIYFIYYIIKFKFFSSKNIKIE